MDNLDKECTGSYDQMTSSVLLKNIWPFAVEKARDQGREVALHFVIFQRKALCVL